MDTKKLFDIQGLTIPACLILLSATVFLIYSNTLNCPFVFDDTGFITEDPAIRMNEFSWKAIKTAAFEGRPKNRLIPNISFALNYYFSHYDVTIYHITNIGIHLATGFLLFFLIYLTLLRFGQSKAIKLPSFPVLIAFFSTLIWLVQPVNSQAVTYIVQRMTSLSALFFISSLLLYVMGRGKWLAEGKITPISGLALLGCLASGVCAVISKQNAGMLPVIILLYEWFFFQKLSLALSKKQTIWIIGGILAFAAIAILYLGDDPIQRILNSYNRRDFTLHERVMTQWRVIIYYITLFFFPHPGRLILDHEYPLSSSMLQPLTTVTSLAAIICLIGLTIYIARRQRLIAFCLVWFLVNLVIESSVIGIEIIYEHRTYLPFMFLILSAAYLVLKHIRPAKIAIGCLCLVTAIFSLWVYQRNTIWESRVSFWEDNASKAPKDFRPHNDLGAAYYDAEQIDSAIIQYRKALELKPHHPDALNNLGNALKNKGRMGQAIACYQKALQNNPRHIKARNNLAAALINKNRHREALNHLNQILNRHPDNAEAHVNAATALARLKRIDKAISHLEKALAIHPDIAETHNNIGVLLIQKGDFQSALSHFKAALRIRPGYISARENLQKLQRMMGR